MGYDNFRMRLQPRLDPPSLPVPEHDIPLAVTAADPLSVRRKSDLTGVSRHRVPRESLLAVLPEVIRVVYEDLVVKGLCGEVFLCRTRFSHKALETSAIDYSLEG